MNNTPKIIVKNNLTGMPLSNGDTLYTIEQSSIDISVADKSIFRYHDTEILWDFGDGTQIKGKSASHFYKEPGVYKLNFTFFDGNNNPVTGDFSEYKYTIIVKDVIETKLEFTEDYINKCNNGLLTDIQAGEIFEAGEFISYLSANIKENVPIKLNENNPHIEKNYFDLNDTNHFKHLVAYHSFFDTKQNPIKELLPEYFSAYITFKTENNTSKIYIIDDTLSIDIDKINLSSFNIGDELIVISSIDEISYLNPVYIGKVGYAKLFYRDDLASDTEIKINYVLDQNYFPDTNTLISKNSINLVSLGINFKVKANTLSGNEKIFISTNGLCSNIITKDNIDNINELSFNTYSFKRAKYKNVNSPFVIRLLSDTDDPYFIKDISIDNLKFENITDNFYINTEEFYIDKNINEPYKKYGSAICNFVPLKESEGNSCTIKLTINGTEYTYTLSDIEIIDFESFKNKDSKYYLNPRQNGEDFSIINFWKAYQTHPAVQDKDNLTNYIYALFGTDEILKTIINKGFNFIDDTNNITTCSIKNIISILDSLNQNIDLYNNENFSQPLIINELLKICSINHSKLIGTTIKVPDEFETIDHLPGKNRGRELTLNEHIIVKEADSDIYNWPKIICYDKFAKEYKVLNTALLEKEYSQSALHTDDEGNIYFILNDYFISWGWNLILGKYEEAKINILTPNKAPNIMELLTSEIEYSRAGENILHFYTFYQYIATDDTIVENSYIDPETISDNIKDYQKWYKIDGSIDRLLYKVLVESLNL